MGTPLWKIEGFETAAGNRVVEDWFWDDIDEDERDALRDRMGYLTITPRHLWKEPRFKWFGDMRVYGFFPAERPDRFVFLHGVIKKANKDLEGIAVARTRLKRLSRGEGRTHEFDFEKRTS
jgi:hypothetical protein